MNIVILLIIVILIIFFIKKNTNKQNLSNSTIIQLNNNNINKLKKELDNYQPIIITNILTKFESFETLCFEVLSNFTDNIKVSKKNKLLEDDSYSMTIDSFIKNIQNNGLVVYNDDHFFETYTFQNITEDINNLLNCFKTYYHINIFPSDTNTPILKNTRDYIFLFIYDGDISLNLINPFENPTIDSYPITYKNKTSVVSIPEDTKNTLNVVQIIARTGKIVSIPKGWLYYYTSDSPSIVVTAYGSNFLNQIFSS